MAKRRVATGRAWATRDVSPEDLPDLLTAPPRASLAWVDDDSAIRLAPVHARFDGSTWQVGRAGTDPDLDNREVVLVVDDGPGWFELRSVTVRGTASAEPPTAPHRWSIRPRRIVAWDYGSLRLTEGNDPGGPLGPPPPEPPENLPTPVQLPPEAARVIRRARVLLLATASARSRPFCVPEWFLHHRGTFVMSTGAGSWSARNAVANPQVQLLIGGEERPSEPRVRIIGQVVCRRTLPPADALLRIGLRYYLTPRRARVELRHWRQWRLRQRYYGQTGGGPAYLVVTPTHVDVLPPPQRPPPVSAFDMMRGGQTHRCREDRVRTESLPDPQAQEARALRWSAGTGVALALLGVGWGLAARSQIILFDGVYAVLGTILSWLSLRASALVAAGPTPRYPFGREALAPLVVAVSALVLLGTFGYACIDAVAVILAGGGDTSIGAAFVYSVVTLVAVVALRAALARHRADSDLVSAEVEQWGAAAVLGVAMVVGFGIAVVLERTEWGFLAPYVDPALVLVAAVLVLPTPIGMLRTSFRELLEGVPDAEVTEPIHEAVRDLRSELGLPEPQCRIGKLGRKVYVELDFVVDPDGAWTVSDADRLRRRLIERLRRPGRLLWLNVELHTDPAWDL